MSQQLPTTSEIDGVMVVPGGPWRRSWGEILRWGQLRKEREVREGREAGLSGSQDRPGKYWMMMVQKQRQGAASTRG